MIPLMVSILLIMRYFLILVINHNQLCTTISIMYNYSNYVYYFLDNDRLTGDICCSVSG